MANIYEIMQAINDAVFEKVKEGDLNIEDLNLAAVTLLHVKERERLEDNVLAPKE